MNEVLFGFDYLTYYFYLLYYKFIGYPVVVRVCIAVVAVCAVCYFFLAIYLIYGIYSRQRDKKRADRIHQRYHDRLTQILSDRENVSTSEQSKILEHDPKKRLKAQEMRPLVQLIATIKTELGEKTNNYNLQGVQAVFKIGSFFEREIQFGRDQHKILALHSIQSINGYVSEAVLVRFLYHSRPELRSAARFAYMWLSQNNPFRFFDEDVAMKLSQWEMAEIHMILQHRQTMGFIVPNFIKWVNVAVEDNVKAFFVAEIKHFNQEENCAPLVEMLNTKTWLLRNEIIRTLGDMKYIDSEPKMVEIYDVQPEYIKGNILTAVTGMQTSIALGFLHAAYESADDLGTKLNALKCIYIYGEPGRELFTSLKELTTGVPMRLFAHVEHPLTNKL